MDIKETIIFNGVEYRLLSGGRYYLSQSTTNDGRRHAKSLHVAIWEYYNKKPCPKGYEIHHIDGNCSNTIILPGLLPFLQIAISIHKVFSIAQLLRQRLFICGVCG